MRCAYDDLSYVVYQSVVYRNIAGLHQLIMVSEQVCAAQDRAGTRHGDQAHSKGD